MASEEREGLPELGGDYAVDTFVPGANAIVLRVIGRGGQATVYEMEMAARLPETGEIERFGMKVAVKVIHPHLAGNPRAFMTEARTLLTLVHPHIVNMRTAGFTDDDRKLAYIVMELLEGINGRQLLLKERLLVPSVLDIAIGLASGLAMAHGKGIIHLDIKPENIFVHNVKDEKTGVVRAFPKLFDWGIREIEGRANIDPSAPMATSPSGPPVEVANSGSTLPPRDTRGEPGGAEGPPQGRFQGTPHYSAPEQLQGSPATRRTDVYAFGVTMFELLTGRRPFSRAEHLDAKAKDAGRLGQDVDWQKANEHLIYAKLHDDAPKLSSAIGQVPKALEDLVARCLARDPARRPEDASVLEKELLEIRRTLDPYFLKGYANTQEILLERIASVNPDSSAALRAVSKAQAPSALSALPGSAPEEVPAPRERRPGFARLAAASAIPDAVPSGHPSARAAERSQPSYAALGPETQGAEAELPRTLEGGVRTIARAVPARTRALAAGIATAAVLCVAVSTGAYLVVAHAHSSASATTDTSGSAPSSGPPKEIPAASLTVAAPIASPAVPDVAPTQASAPSKPREAETSEPAAPDSVGSERPTETASPPPEATSPSVSPHRSSATPPKEHPSGPKRLEDSIHSPTAKPFARRAEELAKSGDLEQAMIQASMAKHYEPNNPALDAFLNGLEARRKPK